MRTILPQAGSSVAQPHGLREPYLGISSPLCKMAVSFYFDVIDIRIANTQLNLPYTKITLLIVIDFDPRIRELTRPSLD